MSESLISIVKIVTSVVSIRACVIYICIALASLGIWIISSSIPLPESMPKEYQIFSINLLGIGVGALFGNFLNFFIKLIINHISSEKEKKEKIKEELKQKDLKITLQKNKETLIKNKFEEIFPHLFYNQKKIIFSLIKSDMTLDLINSEERALLEAGLVTSVCKLAGQKTLCRLVPEIRPLAEAYYEEFCSNAVDSILEDISKEHKALLNIMSKKNFKHTRVLDSTLKFCDGFVLKKEKVENGVWIYFDNQDMKSILSAKTNKEYEDEVFIEDSEIIKTEENQ